MYRSKNIKKLITILVLSLWYSCVFSQIIPQQGFDSITPVEMKNHVYFLASDEMKGRDTPSTELDSCARYIANEFKSYGLTPPDSNKKYFQYFNTLKTHLAEPNTFMVGTTGKKESYELKKDFVPLYLTANKKINDVDIVFAGYGITAPELNYDDYKNLDVTGKAVLIFKGEPQKDDSSSIFNGTRDTDYAKIRVKIENAREKGAVGVIVANYPSSMFRRPPNYWPSLMKHPLENAVPLTLEESSGKKIVCVNIGKKLTEDIFEGSEKNFKTILENIDKDLQPRSFLLKDKTVSMETNLRVDKFPTQNVVGCLQGKDENLENELIIIGAHYDHVGTVNDTIIYNGADDNASGTAGVLEIAQAFTSCKNRPKRSILFIAFAGEEKGLFGSRYYTDNPLFPLENTVAMLNLDMISRNDSNEVAIIGSGTSGDLKEINEKANKHINLDLAYDQEVYFRNSDHYSFYNKNIPVLFYNTKSTPDLHQPTDDPEKIIPEKMAKIGKLIFSTAWIIANTTERPDFSKIK